MDFTDEELISYCDLHCETPRALFHSDHVNRMIDLAGRPEETQPLPEGFYSMHEDMKVLVRLARENQQ